MESISLHDTACSSPPPLLGLLRRRSVTALTPKLRSDTKQKLWRISIDASAVNSFRIWCWDIFKLSMPLQKVNVVISIKLSKNV
eukprot:scaffold6708_cov153-Skeletonema_marinoi.AAC.8